MSYWYGPSRWVSGLLMFIVGFIGFDALFKLLDANAGNGIVAFVAAVAGLFLAPFRTMFSGDNFLLEALVAILGYAILAGIIVAVIDRAHRAGAHRREGRGTRRRVIRER